MERIAKTHRSFSNGVKAGLGIGVGIALFVATTAAVSEIIHYFQAGDLVSASMINENFEGIDSRIDVHASELTAINAGLQTVADRLNITLPAELTTSFNTVDTSIASHETRLDGIDRWQPPVGTIMAWHKNLAGVSHSLPIGWTECNGQVVTINGVSVGLPNLNGEGRFLRGASTSGNPQDDAFQGHSVKIFGHDEVVGGANDHLGINMQTHAGGRIHSETDRSSDGVRQHELVDNGHGPLRVDHETRPKNMSVVWIIRIQ